MLRYIQLSQHAQRDTGWVMVATGQLQTSNRNLRCADPAPRLHLITVPVKFQHFCPKLRSSHTSTLLPKPITVFRTSKPPSKPTPTRPKQQKRDGIKTPTHSPVAKSHTWMQPSLPPLTSALPSGCHASDSVLPSTLANDLTYSHPGAPGTTLSTLTLPSSHAAARSCPLDAIPLPKDALGSEAPF